MVSAGGGRTELNIRTMSEMLRRYFFQNASTDNDENGNAIPIPTNIIERVMKGRWGSEGAPTCFPGNDRSQKRLILMCKNQLRIKLEAFEMDMEIIRTAEKRNRALAYREHLKMCLKKKLDSYKNIQKNLKLQKKTLKKKSMEDAIDENEEMLTMIDRMSDDYLLKNKMSDILKNGQKLSKRRRINNKLKMVQQKEKRFIASTKARTLNNRDEIPMYVFRKWKPPPPKPLPPPPPPRKPGILTRFAMGTYKYVLKPIGSTVVGTVRKIKQLRELVKEMQAAEEFESDSEDEGNGGDGEDSDDEIKQADAPIDVFGLADDEEDEDKE